VFCCFLSFGLHKCGGRRVGRGKIEDEIKGEIVMINRKESITRKQKWVEQKDYVQMWCEIRHMSVG
jgi:hypothetical protein